MVPLQSIDMLIQSLQDITKDTSCEEYEKWTICKSMIDEFYKTFMIEIPHIPKTYNVGLFIFGENYQEFYEGTVNLTTFILISKLHGAYLSYDNMIEIDHDLEFSVRELFNYFIGRFSNSVKDSKYCVQHKSLEKLNVTSHCLDYVCDPDILDPQKYDILVVLNVPLTNTLLE